MSKSRHIPIVIIGSGFAGLGMAIRLRQAGIEDFAIFERANDVGGVWRDNTYPGCACDVESHLYSFSFAPNAEWSRSFSPQAEIHAYLRGCVEKFGLAPHLRFGHGLARAAWNDAERRWHLETTQGLFTADIFIGAVGGLNEPLYPEIPGRESFAGVSFHSSRWNHSHDLAGQSVAVIGTGASAAQFVPAIQPRVGKLSVFQRTPPWVMPRLDAAITERKKSRFRRSHFALASKRAAIYLQREIFALPFFFPRLAQLGEQLALHYLRRAVPDPVLRAKLTPRYRLGCKRVLVSDDFLPSLAKPNVEVVTEKIREIRPHSIVTADGVERAVDTIIYGTGFRIGDLPIAKQVFGRAGRSLDEHWNGTAWAHLGFALNGFPNFFLLLGPNTALGHSSVIMMMESHFEMTLAAIRHLREQGKTEIEPRADAERKFVARVDAKMRGTVWTAGGCKSWYLDASGRNFALWPGFTFTFFRAARFRAAEYEVR